MADRKFNPAAPSNPRKREPKGKLIAIDFREYRIEQALEELLEMARAGKFNGLVCALSVTHKGGEPYLFASAGHFVDNPIEAIGAAALLQSKITREM